MALLDFLRGPAGPQGPAGPPGPAGPTGGTDPRIYIIELNIDEDVVPDTDTIAKIYYISGTDPDDRVIQGTLKTLPGTDVPDSPINLQVSSQYAALALQRNDGTPVHGHFHGKIRVAFLKAA